NKKARVALDVGQEAIRFRNPHLPETRSELALPLVIGNDILGALTIQSVAPDAFDDDDIIVLQNISDSLAVALENARLFQQFETSLKEIQSLNRQYLEGAWTSVTNQENKDLTYTKENESIPFSEDEILNSLNIPLTLRDEQVIGNINIEANRSEWSAEDQEFITAVSNQAAIALESARLLEETQLRVERERKLNDLTAKFSGTVNFEELMKTVVQELGQLPNVVQAEIHVSPPDATTVTTNGTPPEKGD
ncbi:MAG: GAF domain-containing protein, partial [Chloroflexota bacterium]